MHWWMPQAWTTFSSAYLATMRLKTWLRLQDLIGSLNTHHSEGCSGLCQLPCGCRSTWRVYLFTQLEVRTSGFPWAGLNLRTLTHTTAMPFRWARCSKWENGMVWIILRSYTRSSQEQFWEWWKRMDRKLGIVFSSILRSYPLQGHPGGLTNHL